MMSLNWKERSSVFLHIWFPVAVLSFIALCSAAGLPDHALKVAKKELKVCLEKKLYSAITITSYTETKSNASTFSGPCCI